ncbi:MAG: hypothetical protein PGN23_12640 [Sphingomonas adhaesiva]|uniref:hypothetical protein n=1 Tax=Sphingomonas adhaesiva TaxID=28212 RepID=UPI002FF57A61
MDEPIDRSSEDEQAYFSARAASHTQQALRAENEPQRVIHTRFAQLYAAKAARALVDRD